MNLINKILQEAIHNDPIVSSNIIDVTYDDETEILTIQFKNGGVYEYSNVPLEKYEEFKNAPSVGSFAHKQIYPFYQTQKIA